MQFVKLNEEPIEIKYVVCSEEDFIVSGKEDVEAEPVFKWDGETYYLNGFVRTHNNPFSGIPDCPDYIHGYEPTRYWKGLFVELVGSDYVNVYEERED